MKAAFVGFGEVNTPKELLLKSVTMRQKTSKKRVWNLSKFIP